MRVLILRQMVDSLFEIFQFAMIKVTRAKKILPGLEQKKLNLFLDINSVLGPLRNSLSACVSKPT